MKEVLEVVLGVIVATTVGAGLVACFALHRVRRANRVAPAHRTAAPLHWLCSPGRAAQLHRRLRRATRMVIAATQPLGPQSRRRKTRAAGGVLDGTGQELVRRAVTIDARIVACDRGGSSSRRRQLGELAREVAALESSAARLASLSNDLRRQIDELGAVRPDDAELGLDALEAAIGELRVVGEPARIADEPVPPRTA